MAATGTPTPNIGLRCPVGTDPASVDDINYNSGVLDTKLGAVGSTSVQAQIDALNSKLTTNYSANINGVKAIVYRFGNVVFCNFLDGSYSNDNNGYMIDATTQENIVIPNGYKPIARTFMKDAEAGIKLDFRTNGYIVIAGTNVAVRIGACWITGDATPT